ncbi:DUF4129 domain-containing protein [Microbacterium bovistercoris]|uniref:DUF4129 domain-containing protein n=1 Tax=Microbacterium bovistercoris TaxID=2293570 RepID=A0A371NV90_9MICO|nr:DUF4129 domain-containing protein [Microbacterium bovistercoris]REJ06533.1 DUF4129 domain-containing protein [Microbacterium bovistercoris]
MTFPPAYADVFVPDGDEARRWAQEELSKQIYEAAKPTWFDRMSRAIMEFLSSLFTVDGSGAIAPFAGVLITVIIVAALIVALIVWGRPRASRTVRRGARLLGEADDRTAAQLRADAERAARDGDWDAAVTLRFRGLARGLIERDLIDPAPGATAQAISRDAGAVLPVEHAALHDAASSFDRVRYLRVPADEADYRAIAATDDRLKALHPEAVPA